MFKCVYLNRGAKYYYPEVTTKVSTVLMTFISTAHQLQFLTSKEYTLLFVKRKDSTGFQNNMYDDWVKFR